MSRFWKAMKIFFKSSQYTAYLSGFNIGISLFCLLLENWVMFWWFLIIGAIGIPLWVRKIHEED